MMIGSTLTQYKFFLLFLGLGFLVALALSILSTTKLSFRHVILTNIIDFVLTLGFLGVFVTTNLYICYGEFRWYILLAYLLGAFLERVTIGKMIAKVSRIVYTYLCQGFSRLSKTQLWKKVTK